jgi:hypothetical protein
VIHRPNAYAQQPGHADSTLNQEETPFTWPACWIIWFGVYLQRLVSA